MIKPINNNLVIKPLEEKTVSGIVIPDSAKEKPQLGEVVESDSKLVKKGQIVFYKKWGGDEIEDLMIVHEKDILAIKL